MSVKTVFAEKEQAKRQEQEAVLQAFKDQTAESARLAAAEVPRIEASLLRADQ